MFEKGRCDTVSKITSNGKDSAENFDDMISLFIARAIGLSDNQDSDGDGLTDCREINGMVLPNSKIVQSDPRDPDTDKDGLTDGEEMNVGAKVYTYRECKNLLPNVLLYDVETDMDNDIFTAYYGIKSDPTKIDSDDDGYNDFRINGKNDLSDPNPFVLDIHVYAINESDRYVPITEYKADKVTVGKVYYGGNQSWFSNYNGKQGKKIQTNGCGAIAALDVFLYFALNGVIYTSDINKYFLEIDNGIIKYEEYIDWVLYWTEPEKLLSYKQYEVFGAWGSTVVRWFNRYYDTEFIENSGVIRHPKFEDFSYVYMSDYRKSVIQKNIIDMIKRNIPVMILIGPNILGDELPIYKIIDPSDTSFDTSDISIIQLSENQKTDKHWLTITEFIVDDVTNKKYIKVQSWGDVYYLDYDKWLECQDGTWWDGILFM